MLWDKQSVGLRKLRLFLLAAVAVVLCSGSAEASVTLLVGEPFGSFGTLMPVGHAAIYLDHVCADGPLKLRQCRFGEQEGVVIARYHRLGETDWVASPVMQFLYATDRPQDVPEYATAAQVWELREAYRRHFLAEIVPDGSEKDRATDEWWETVGAAYNRRFWGYQLETTPAQDAAIIARMNQDVNHHRYHLRKTNCANFAADMMNAYFPGMVERGDHIADFGLMTPKQVARCVEAYGEAHPELQLRVMEIDQVPGSLRRSRPVRGAAEAGLKTKRYLATLLVIQPEIPAGLGILYLAHGRWQMGKGAEKMGPEAFEGSAPSVVATR